MRIPNQRHANIVLDGPSRMLRDGGDDAFGNTPGFARTFSIWLSVRKAFASASLIACGWPSASSAPTTRDGAAARQSQFLADRQVRHARDDQFFGDATDFRGRRGQQAQANQIEQIKLPEQRQRESARRARMARQAQPHAFAGMSTSLFLRWP